MTTTARTARAATGPLTFPEAFDLPLSMDLRTAARAFGVCPATAYKLIRLGQFPCPVLRIGHKYRIPTAFVLRTLGIEERPIYAVDLETGAEYAASYRDARSRLSLSSKRTPSPVPRVKEES